MITNSEPYCPTINLTKTCKKETACYCSRWKWRTLPRVRLSKVELQVPLCAIGARLRVPHGLERNKPWLAFLRRFKTVGFQMGSGIPRFPCGVPSLQNTFFLTCTGYNKIRRLGQIWHPYGWGVQGSGSLRLLGNLLRNPRALPYTNFSCAFRNIRVRSHGAPWLELISPGSGRTFCRS